MSSGDANEKMTWEKMKGVFNEQFKRPHTDFSFVSAMAAFDFFESNFAKFAALKGYVPRPEATSEKTADETKLREAIRLLTNSVSDVQVCNSFALLQDLTEAMNRVFEAMGEDRRVQCQGYIDWVEDVTNGDD